ncbi:hypothetical protein LPJ59_003224 [Coemansia sp. RSA 2399]|nr:hypothetical protein LPJ59_003224 [Coemansia sp. RSA 2399]
MPAKHPMPMPMPHPTEHLDPVVGNVVSVDPAIRSLSVPLVDSVGRIPSGSFLFTEELSTEELSALELSTAGLSDPLTLNTRVTGADVVSTGAPRTKAINTANNISSCILVYV